MDEKRKEEEARELTPEEIDDMIFEEQIASGNIIVKNLSAFWLPDVKIVENIGGTEYTVTGSYEGTETLDKKLRRIMEQNAADDESDITEDGE